MTPCNEIAFDGGGRQPNFSFVVVEIRKPEISTRVFPKTWNHPILTD